MIDLRFDIDVSALEERTRYSEEIVASGNRNAVYQAAIEGADYARSNHPHKEKTGRLTGPELFARLVSSSKTQATAEIRNETPYAWFVEYGTVAHVIRPKEGFGFVGPLLAGQSRRAITDIGTHRIALRWYVGDTPVFARAVFHPGTIPMPFVEPAAEYAGLRIAFHNETSTLVDLARYWDS